MCCRMLGLPRIWNRNRIYDELNPLTYHGTRTRTPAGHIPPPLLRHHSPHTLPILSLPSFPHNPPIPFPSPSPIPHPTPPTTAGVHGQITRFVTTIPSASSTYHFYELDVSTLDQEWLESHERRREWVDYAEAVRRLQWKAELAQGFAMCSLAPTQGRR